MRLRGLLRHVRAGRLPLRERSASGGSLEGEPGYPPEAPAGGGKGRGGEGGYSPHRRPRRREKGGEGGGFDALRRILSIVQVVPKSGQRGSSNLTYTHTHRITL